MSNKSIKDKILNKNESSLENMMESLDAARKFQDEKIKMGSSCIKNYVDGVEGDWLKNLSLEGIEDAKETKSSTS